MEFRSTNDNGYVHFQGDVVSNVSSGQGINSSHGVQLTGGSTGGVVTAAGDEANIALNIRPKGAGPLNLNSTQTFLGQTSTTPVAYLQRYRIDWTIPALSSAGAAGASVDSTVTVTGLTTNGIYIFQETQVWNSSVDPGIIITARCSTANELKLTQHNVSGSSLSGSTKSGNLFHIGF